MIEITQYYRDGVAKGEHNQDMVCRASNGTRDGAVDDDVGDDGDDADGDDDVDDDKEAI